MLLLSTLLLAVLTATANANKWVMTAETSNTWMAGYVGDVTVCFTYRPGVPVTLPEEEVTSSNETTTTTTVASIPIKREECKTLPNKRFARGKTYMFELEFYEIVDVLEQVKLFGKPSGTSVCKRKGAQDSWHLRELSFQDMLTGRLFSPQKKLVVETRCSQHNELVLENLNVTQAPRPCPMDGVIYKSGERFDDGCSGRCKCEDAAISCVSLCPPFIAPGCRAIHVPGECCQKFICENSSSFNHRACPKYEDGDCEMANRTVAPGEYPWTVFIKLCPDNVCRKFCSGVLINERFVLTAGECLRGIANISQDVRVIVGENTIALRDDLDVEIAIENVTFSNAKVQGEQMALLKLKDSIVFDQTVQPATLPMSREQCHALIRPRCATSLTGWVNVDAESQQYDLYQLSVNLLDWFECDSTNSTPVFSGRKRKPLPPSVARTMCVDLSSDDSTNGQECGACQDSVDGTGVCQNDKKYYMCSGERGRALVSKVSVPSTGDFPIEVNYLVGLVAYQMAAGETPMDVCTKPAYKLAVSICNEIDWISDNTQFYYDFYSK